MFPNYIHLDFVEQAELKKDRGNLRSMKPVKVIIKFMFSKQLIKTNYFSNFLADINSIAAREKTAVIIITPPTKLMNVGSSLKNNQTQIGANENSRRLNNVISAANK